MALAMGDATPVVEIMERTPDIPASCQWGVFLRNHDELTLEMVTEDERAFMYGHYAPDPGMRKNMGIRRRLAPLLDGDRRKIELLQGILLALPGSPVLYYGDEIGMGDRFLLEDRDGVRTPMQWTDAPGAGFSTADPDDFYLPLVDAPEYAPPATNVAAQQGDDASLLSWVRGMLALRRQHPVMGTGAFAAVAASHPSVLAFERRAADARILVVANLADEEITADLTLPAGISYRSLLTGESAPAASFHLAPYAFDWLVPE
jgi:maltose alpha-D-glucosyltransferase/alpha-amylase